MMANGSNVCPVSSKSYIRQYVDRQSHEKTCAIVEIKEEEKASSSQLSLAPFLLDLPDLSRALSEPDHVPFYEAPPHLEHGRGQRGDEGQVRRDEVVGECDGLRRRQRH